MRNCIYTEGSKVLLVFDEKFVWKVSKKYQELCFRLRISLIFTVFIRGVYIYIARICI